MALTEHAPGIYFGLPAEEYHADPALSTGGIKDLLESPLTYWVNSRLNPDFEEPEDTTATETGSAFHKRLLEGREAFDAVYAVAPDPADYPEAIAGGEAIKARCKEMGLKANVTLLEMAERIREQDPAAVLWPIIQAEAEEVAGERTILKPEIAKQIEGIASVIEHHPSARKALVGGFSEVSIFWIDESTGVRMKCRPDYLKTRAAVDVKTFSNSQGLPVDVAVTRAVASYRYHVQAVVYSEGIEAAKLLVREIGSKAVFAMGDRSPDAAWLKAFAEHPEHAFVFLFLQSGKVPNLRIREFRRLSQAGGDHGETLYWQQGMQGFRRGVELYLANMDKHGADKPWHDDRPMTPFSDDEFPLYMFS